MRYGPIVTNWASLGRAVTCMHLGFKNRSSKPSRNHLKTSRCIPDIRTQCRHGEKFTCKALIRSHTFSWEKTRTGRGGSCPDSGMKILSCERARLPSVPLDSLGRKKHCDPRRVPISPRGARDGAKGTPYNKPSAAFIFFNCL